MVANWTKDEIVLACDLVSNNDWKGMRADDQRAQQLSELLRSASIHPFADRSEVFRSPDSVRRKTFDIATQHPAYSGKPTKGNKLDRIVLFEFLAEPLHMHEVANAIRAALAPGSISRLRDEGETEAWEGSVLMTQHLVRERNPRLRRDKLEQARRLGQRPNCEVCGFDFERTYGALGKDYIEVHHRLPLHASGPRVTRLADLALLCSNCHRMIHHSAPWLTPEDLREKLVETRAVNAS